MSAFILTRVKVTRAAMLLLTVSLFLTGCKGGEPVSPAPGTSPPAVQSKQDTRPLVLDRARDAVVVYFSTPNGKYLVPVTLPINPTQRAVEVAVEKLLAGPPDKSLARTLPEGTKIRGMYLVGNTAFVDLTGEVRRLADKEAAERGIRSLLLTVTEFPGVDQVTLLVDGQAETNLAGLELNQQMPRPEVINPGPQSEARSRIQVYFSDENALYLVPLSLGFKADATIQERARKAVEVLLTGPPTREGLSRTIWAGTRLRDLTVVEGKAIVNLSKQAIGYGGGATAESMLLSSLVYTLTDIPGISEVQLLIEGQKLDHLPEGTEVAKPIRRPDRLNFIDSR